MQRMGVAPGRSHDQVVAAASAQAKSTSKNAAAKIELCSLLLVPVASFGVRVSVLVSWQLHVPCASHVLAQVLGLDENKCRQRIHVPESVIERVRCHCLARVWRKCFTPCACAFIYFVCAWSADAAQNEA
jgi:hypothetical protein